MAEAMHTSVEAATAREDVSTPEHADAAREATEARAHSDTLLALERFLTRRDAVHACTRHVRG